VIARRQVVLAAVVALLALSACGQSSSAKASNRTLNVYAASSLTETFTDLAARFEKDHAGTKVVFNFGASSALATSIVNGAPADVFASAAPRNMATVVSAGAAQAPADFASNTLEIAVPPSNPAHIAVLADLARPGVKVALCDSAVPCGSVAGAVLTKARLTVRPSSVDPDVKSALAKVQLGEVDAALVYVTDVRAAKSKVAGIPIADNVNMATEYPIAVLTRAAQPNLAAQFVELVRSAQGQQVLRQAGFGGP
jgi:molybdate transport system substrate-binding protein